MFHDFRGLAVDFQPGERILERGAVHQRPPCPRRRFQVAQPPLDRQHLAQPLAVAPRDGQETDLQHRRLRPPLAAIQRPRASARPPPAIAIRCRALDRRVVGRLDRRFLVVGMRFGGLEPRHHPDGEQQRAEEQGVGELARQFDEAPPIGVERTQRLPQRLVVGPALQLRRHRLEQAVLGQEPERALGGA